MRMRYRKPSLECAARAASILLLGAAAAFGQIQINLTAEPTSITLPDGSSVPMWGYSCGTAPPNCAKLNPSATGWSPVVITVPTGQDLQINLANRLIFAGPSVASTNRIPTSLTIVGQLGGGLGTTATATPSPTHGPQTLTWPVAGASGDPTNTPPAQGQRVQSFATEVPAGATKSLTWTAPRPGTYLLESGTHPSIQGPMGLYGIVVVTSAPSGSTPGSAYSGVTYGAEVPLLFSEIDPVQNASVNSAVRTTGFSETAVWSGQTGACGDPSVHKCYPPAVNYTPLYYLINGVAFDKSSASTSLFAAAPDSDVTGNVLIRMVNAGLRMHVPTIVGAQTGAPADAGFSLIAEDGFPLPGIHRVQSEVFMAAGKTYDVMINVPSAESALPVFDRQLSLSANGTSRDAGMLAYIGVNGAGLPTAPALTAAAVNADSYNSIISGKPLSISDPAKGVIANDVNVYGVQLVAGSAVGGSVVLNANGTFTFTPTAASGSFQYCANGTASLCATVTLGAAPIEAGTDITVGADAYMSTTAKSLSIKSPGLLENDKDAAGYPLVVDISSVTPASGLVACPTPAPGCLAVNTDGSFTAMPTSSAAGTYSFTYKAKNSQGTLSAAAATVTLTFPAPSSLSVTLVDGKTKAALAAQDYRWIIEEDRTFYVNPACITNPPAAGCPGASSGVLPTFGANFHSSHMPVVAEGCTGPLSCETGQTVLDPSTGTHVDAVCDLGHGVCRAGTSKAATLPGQTALDTTKRYYISVLPGDAGDSGHAMGGSQIAYKNGAWQPVTVIVEPMPLPPATVSAFVYEDDFPLNGEQDSGGGVDVLAPNEPGLGGFNIILYDNVGQFGDPAGQMTYDMFNMPLSNSLAGTIDPATGLDACPISAQASTDPDQKGIVGMIPVCPRYESDGVTLSALAGQAVVRNLPPGMYGVEAKPAADRIARGEEWLQTNTLDGGKAHDSFIKVSEPSYFQEYGPAGYHVAIGFANPAIINGRQPGVCAGATGPNACNHTVKGRVTLAHMSRTPDERLYSTSSRDAFAFTQCYVSFGSPDGADFGFVKCDDQGNFVFTNMPGGDWRITIFDQWNDQILDGYTTPVRVNASVVDMGDVAVHQWRQNLYTRTFFDKNGDGVSQDNEPGLTFVPTNVRYRDGSIANFNSTDLNGFAGFNEVFPIFAWYVTETDALRYKNTGTHVVVDAGGPVDGSTACGKPGIPACGSSAIADHLARTKEDDSLPASLRVPGAVYCDNADCTGFSIANGPDSSASNDLSTGRIDPPWVQSYGWQGFLGQASFLEYGKKPFAAGENGGIRGHVVYASTRPFDDPAMELQLSWEPLVPNVTINLYQEGTAPDGTKSLKLVDTTKTSSWDDWAQGFRSDGVPNMNCPGQSSTDPFYYTLYNQTNTLNPGTALPNNSQFKCYDGMHNWNQLQPAPYTGMYQFPSVAARDPHTGKPTATNCTVCAPNTAAASTDWDYNLPMLPAGKYVVEVVVPPGYELVKEEDKNILFGDTYEAPVTQQFAGLGNIFIMPDQASVASAYNPNNPLNPTTDLGALPRHEGDTGSVEVFWPCVGAARVVPDYMSLFPNSGQNAPFAGATRNLCDRKEVVLEEQSSVLAKFYVFTSTHIASHFTGIITDDFTSEFDPFSPAFSEKFSPPFLPVSIKDWAGNEVSRVYADQWGAYNGMNYSTFGVNPPDPSGYVPAMMVLCMNDRGSGVTPDPLFQPGYSQFCYEMPFMPGNTGYFDTPVVPTTAFAEGYNHPDCDYPDATPTISQVNSQDGLGPWVSAAGRSLTITALGDQSVTNYGYSGPSATADPFNKQTINRHYGFGGVQGSGAVTIGGVNAPVSSWSDSQIVVTAPANVPLCAMQQQAQYGGSQARCGQLVITADNGKTSIDAVTVTIGGKAPTRLTAGQTIQSAIDAASPGDLIIVPPGNYKEMLLMWKPVRLQGVGATSSIINSDTHPAGVIDPWRRQVSCLFGLALNGQPYTGNGPTGGSNPYDAKDPQDGGLSCPGTGWNYFTAQPNVPQVDRIPLGGILGWDTTVNGNLAELLQEPSLMGSYEGAGITVLGKGVRVPAGQDVFGIGAEAGFPAGSSLLTSSDCGSGNSPTGPNANPFPSNFNCNPSSIDGLALTNSSQGGGGIFVHGWGHNIEIANNRVHNNNGTLSGGIQIGQGEFGDGYFQGNTNNPSPGSCQSVGPSNTQLPYCFNTNVKVHNNAVTLNSSTGDELFTSTPSGAGGVTFCTGSDFYKFNYNWVCGNLSSGDGGGVAHLGFSYNGDISHNSILFNQSTNPTVPTSGGGIVVMGPAPDGVTTAGLECGSVNDEDCTPGLSDGTGPGLVINANLIMGNAADSGAGGGIRLQAVNGTEVSRFPLASGNWYTVDITNNIITNNVAGWDGGGVSLLDALAVNFVNNTVASNDSTASSGTLFHSYFAPLGSDQSQPSTTCTSGTNGACTASAPQAAGFSVSPNSPQLTAALPNTVICPAGHAVGLSLINGACRQVSYPLLYNNVFWQNRSFHLEVGSLDTASLQSVVTLVPTLNQPSTAATAPSINGSIVTGGTGACVNGASYWDIGIRGDTGPTNHSSGFTLSPTFSVMTNTSGYGSANNSAPANLGLVSQYCNGSRTPPEYASGGYQVPPGTNEGNVPVPVFSLLAGATVDEGNNWINIKWGPLALTSPMSPSGTPLGNYGPASGSPVINYIPNSLSGLIAYNLAPATDFYGRGRKGNGSVDAGAVEFLATPPPTLTSINPATGYRSSSFTVTLTGTNLTGASAVSVSGLLNGITVSNVQAVNATTVTATFTIGAFAPLNTARDVTVTTPGGTATLNNAFTVVTPPPPTFTSMTPSTGARGATVSVTLTGTNLTGATGVSVSGLLNGITVSNVQAVNATTVTATFTIGSNAPLTIRNVTVSTPGGNATLNNAFTVVTPPPPVAPTLTSISPSQHARNSSFTVTLTGTNFSLATPTVNVTRSSGAVGVNVSNLHVVSDTSLTVTFTLPSNSGLGARSVKVSNSGGSSNAVTFTVQ
jgi:hypothetical protein